MTTTLRAAVNGILDAKDIDRLTWPKAWQGFVSDEERQAQESDLAELVSEVRQIFGANPDAVAIEIRDGQIVGMIVEGE